jgi:hypothetical protein
LVLVVIASGRGKAAAQKPPLLLCAQCGHTAHMKKLIFTSKVVLYPGNGGWHFAYVDDKQSKKLKEIPRKKTRGFGSIKVRAKIGKSVWDTSLFPDKSGPYLLAIKKSVRYEEGIEAGDTVKVSCILL